jgi:superfamily II DNA or RNA helicase
VRVDPAKPHQLIFSISSDTEIGPVLEPYMVQLNSTGGLTLSYQRLYSHTLNPFKDRLDENDLEIIRITTEYSIENISRKFCTKEVRPHEFVSKYLTDKLLKDAVRPFVEDRMYKCMQLMAGKMLFLKGKTGNPAHKALEMIPEHVSVLFHFHKEEQGTRYYPTFYCRNEKLVFINREVFLLTTSPCILLSENKVYYFEQELDGKKLVPFLTKWNIQVPKPSEPQYYRKFISSLIEKYKVKATGFNIYIHRDKPVPVLKLVHGWNGQPQLLLQMNYGQETVNISDLRKVVVKMEKHGGDAYTYHKIYRHHEFENEVKKSLEDVGLLPSEGSVYVPKILHAPSLTAMIQWLSENRDALGKKGLVILQEGLPGNYFVGEIKLDIGVRDQQDWFDVHALVSFGEFTIPFVRLKKYILGGHREFVLPDGSIAILPEEWFSRYKDFLAFSGDNADGELRFKKYHFSMLEESLSLQEQELLKKTPVLQPGIVDDIPEHLQSIMRPYQVDGFRWMKFLNANNFGGCLADDMGLGKTLQTLALLKSSITISKSFSEEEPVAMPDLFANNMSVNPIRVTKKHPCLVVMPTSLVHNWHFEIKKWAPELKTIVYTGNDRDEKLKFLMLSDIVLTSYGTMRNDIEILSKFRFHYIVLDESQAIKNPSAKVSRAVRHLKSDYKITLTGTPIENSLTDLWSQMAFLNPGLLGTYQYFRDEYVIPIEKKNDDARRIKLQKLINPFILRRTKEEVAKDLPELSEKVFFCEMSVSQRAEYERIRNFYRKQILENMETWGERKAQFYILRGLMQLRLIANHPVMMNEEFDGTSGKFEDIKDTLESILEEKHRVLIFSQFVKHLNIVEKYLETREIAYSKLTGQTRLRESVIQQFRDDESRKVFLISLKAGGVGLNLTEADYVFLLDPWWNPATEQQAISRAHRIGQSKKVIAYRFISRNTVEEKILMLQERKLNLSAGLIRTGTPDFGWSQEDIGLLFS